MFGGAVSGDDDLLGEPDGKTGEMVELDAWDK
jgi:hypothetical protein